MIIVLKPEATEHEIDHVMDRLKELGLTPHLSKGQERTIIGVIGDDRILQNQPLRAIPGVEDVVPILAPWKLAGREFKKDDTIIDVGGVKIGGRKLAGGSVGRLRCRVGRPGGGVAVSHTDDGLCTGQELPGVKALVKVPGQIGHFAVATCAQPLSEIVLAFDGYGLAHTGQREA